jgi:integrase
MKLTANAVRTLNLPDGKCEAIFFDEDLPGFGLRLRERGSRTFIYQYKIGAKQRRMALGAATALRIGDVRKTAERLHARVKLGEDPAGDKADAKVRAAETFRVAADSFLEHQRPRLRPRTFPDVERHLLKHAKTLHGLQLAQIERRDIATVIASVSKNNGVVTGNRARTTLATFFAWAVQSGLRDDNPVIGTARNKEHSRARVLSPSELRAIWNALGDDHYGAIIRLLALTGQRPAEIAGLRWSEIHGDIIVLPGERTKNKRAHVVPLSSAARASVEKQQPRAAADGGQRDLIFGLGAGAFSGWSSCKERLDARIRAMTGKAIPHWTPHDLRRTFATYAGGGLPPEQLQKLPRREQEMARGLGVQPHVIEAVLNHVSGTIRGVAAIYNRSTYEPEKRAALNQWAAHLTAIVEDRDSNVTPLRREA